MLLTYEQVAQAAMQLSSDERVDLAEKLWVSVDTPEAIAAAWNEEIARRVAQLDAGEAETVPAEQVIADLLATRTAQRASTPERKQSRFSLRQPPLMPGKLARV